MPQLFSDSFLSSHIHPNSEPGPNLSVGWMGIRGSFNCNMAENSATKVQRHLQNQGLYARRLLCVSLLVLDKEVPVYVGPYAGDTGEEFTLMDDNALPHIAGLVEVYLEDQGSERMD
ncbi:hypothetical protein AVEN_57171-1 [Araneus ventricosus]|uniref:Uncharacterized protein n=1 Tax=Araneus ventricosus TaxID=182803 RepID=A0A4Y2HFS4_ARAVE|nr:hypothetical protein AVEN_57171-1 [Araneus ventricosus]